MQTPYDQVQITYDTSGKPASVIMPFTVFKKLMPPRDIKTILKESSAIAKKYGYSLKEALATLREVRQELYQEQYI